MRKVWNGKKTVHILAVSAFAGSLLLGVAHGVEAKRLHDPAVAAKVDMEQNIGKLSVRGQALEAPPREGTLKSRIEAILHPQEEETAPAAPLVPATVSASDDSILGTPLASPEQCVRYLLSVNPNPSITVSPEELVSYYYEEGQREGIRPDVAFVQALKETGFFRYGGTVTADQNNYCGLGTTSAVVKGAYFPTSKIGVRAHIQHLLAYTTTRRPAEPVVDPRYELVRGTYGTKTLTKWEDLNGRWAVPGHSYGQSILSMYRAMLRQ